MKEKRCNKCGETKPVDNFYTIQRKDRCKPHLYHRCKSCCGNVKSNSYAYYRNYELVSKYGITLDEYLTQTSLRENRCDICLETVKTLHVDHNHTTGKIRGYLCGSCNRGIGLLKDSPRILESAKTYLEEND